MMSVDPLVINYSFLRWETKGWPLHIMRMLKEVSKQEINKINNVLQKCRKNISSTFETKFGKQYCIVSLSMSWKVMFLKLENIYRSLIYETRLFLATKLHWTRRAMTVETFTYKQTHTDTHRPNPSKTFAESRYGGKSSLIISRKCMLSKHEGLLSLTSTFSQWEAFFFFERLHPLLREQDLGKLHWWLKVIQMRELAVHQVIKQTSSISQPEKGLRREGKKHII